MTDRTYSRSRDARRAAKRELGDAAVEGTDFILVEKDGRWSFEQLQAVERPTRKASKAKSITREEWLTRMTQLLHRKLFKGAHPHVSSQLPAFRVSCSWPGGGSARKRIGECWPPSASADNVIEMFISPTIAEPTKVVGILIHEMVHMYQFAAGFDGGHGKDFRDMATAVGLTGKMTATTESDELVKRITEEFLPALPEYPHAKLDTASRDKQKTYLIKATCTNDECGCPIRITRKWVDVAMVEGQDLSCPLCQEPMAIEEK